MAQGSKTKRSKSPASARVNMALTRQIARQEMALGLMSLFRPLPDGAARREVVSEQRFAGALVRVRGIEMSTFEQGIFLALLALGLGQIRGGAMTTAREAGLLPELGGTGVKRDGENLAGEQPCLQIETSLAELCRMAGLDEDPGATTRRAIIAGFERLQALTVAAEWGEGKWGVSSLIAGGFRGDGTGAVKVTINPRSTQALQGLSRSYSSISMRSWRALKGPTARTLYAWLAAWFNGQSGARKISIDALEGHVFGGVAQDKSTRSRRRAALRAGLQSLRDATWGEWEARVESGQASVTRTFTPSSAQPGRQEIHEPRPAINRTPSSYQPAHSQNDAVQVVCTSTHNTPKKTSPSPVSARA